MTQRSPKNILVTGGAGFIGSNFVHCVLEAQLDVRVVNLDLLTYAGNRDNLEGVIDSPRHVFVHGSIIDQKLVGELLAEYEIDSIVNFAAESHVDRSITGPEVFIKTNVQGVLSLLEAAVAYGRLECFLQVSTDEVYGALALDSEEKFKEDRLLAPRNAYSASKVAAEYLVAAYDATHGLRFLITRGTNSYGSFQFPEKLIPLMIQKALNDERLPVYGDGLHVREWLYVTDHCAALWAALTGGRVGEVYNISSDEEFPNLEVVHAILDRLGKPRSLIEHVKDRPGHDRRYATDSAKARKELGWAPAVAFEEGIERTIDWYRSHASWLERIASGAYRET